MAPASCDFTPTCSAWAAASSHCSGTVWPLAMGGGSLHLSYSPAPVTFDGTEHIFSCSSYTNRLIEPQMNLCYRIHQIAASQLDFLSHYTFICCLQRQPIPSPLTPLVDWAIASPGALCRNYSQLPSEACGKLLQLIFSFHIHLCLSSSLLWSWILMSSMAISLCLLFSWSAFWSA